MSREPLQQGHGVTASGSKDLRSSSYSWLKLYSEGPSEAPRGVLLQHDEVLFLHVIDLFTE